MEKVSSSERFKTVMDERNLRQADILNLVLPYWSESIQKE